MITFIEDRKKIVLIFEFLLETNFYLCNTVWNVKIMFAILVILLLVPSYINIAAINFRYGVDRDVLQPDARGSDRKGARIRAYR